MRRMRQTWRTASAFVIVVLGISLVGRASAFPLTVSGKITSVDPNGRSFTVQTGLLAATEFQINPQTRIEQGRLPLALKELVPGDRVTVEYERGEDVRVAQVVRVLTTDSPAP